MKRPRVKLRRLRPTDAEFLLALLTQQSWVDNIGDRGVRNAHAARGYLTRRIDAQFAEFGFGMYGIELCDEATLVGIAGLVKRASLPDPDLGFALLDRYSGRGLACDASMMVLEEARALGLKRLMAITSPKNVRSMAVLERLGFALEGEEQAAEGGVRVLRYSRNL